jgi:hypothetical protein
VQVSIFCSVDFAFFVLPTSRKPDDDYSVLSGVERSCYAFATCPSPLSLIGPVLPAWTMDVIGF